MPYTEAQKRASAKYHKAHLEQISIRVLRGEKELLRSEAAAQGMSMTQYLIKAVNDQAGRQLLTPSDSEQ